MMFKKVLIVEDHESVSISVQKSLADLGIVHDNRNYVYYCDDAIKRIQKAIAEGMPYELMITDLSFEDDSPQIIHGGIELIKAARKIQPDLKVLVFSIENRMAIAGPLVKELEINAYVPKARHDAKDLKLAIEAILENKKYLSPNLRQTIVQEISYEFTAYDKTIITLLSKGTPQKDIPLHLQKNNIKPAGLSSVEKRLSYIKTTLDFSNNEQLVAHCKDRQII